MRDPIDFAKIKELIPLMEVLERLGWEPVRTEPYATRGPCPLCSHSGSRSRKFAANSKGWYCWGCRKKGDVVNLWAEYHGLSLGHAAISLCAAFYVPVPRQSGPHRNRGRVSP